MANERTQADSGRHIESGTARGSEVRGGSEGDEHLEEVGTDGELSASSEESDQSGTRGARGKPASADKGH